MKKILNVLAACSLLIGGAQVAVAQQEEAYPSQPIKFIVPYSPGGLGDTFSRALARGMNYPPL